MIMKLQVSASDLASALSSVERVANSRVDFPLLSGIRIQATDGQVRLHATDLELFLEATIPAKVDEPGDVVLEAKLLSGLVKRLPNEPISLRSGDRTVELSCGTSKLSMQFQEATEFPSLPEPENAVTWKIQHEALKDMIEKTSFATADDPGRPSLQGILVEASPEELRLVATDGNRLALARHAWTSEETSPDQSITVIVPGQSFSEFRRVPELPEAQDLVTVKMDSRQAEFVLSDWRMVTRLIEGQFPHYRAAIPSDQPIQVRIARRLLLEAVERMEVLAPRNEPVFVRMALEPGLLRLSAEKEDRGSMVEEIKNGYQGEPFQTAYQARFLVDALKSYTSETVVWSASETMGPAMWRPAEDETALCVMMPVRV